MIPGRELVANLPYILRFLTLIIGRELRISEEKRVPKFQKKHRYAGHFHTYCIYNMRICDNCQGAVAFLKQCRMTRGASIPSMICSGAM